MADLDLDALEQDARDDVEERERLDDERGFSADVLTLLSRLRAAEERARELEAEAVKLRVDHASWCLERKELIARHGELADRALVAEHDLRAAERERDEARDAHVEEAGRLSQCIRERDAERSMLASVDRMYRAAMAERDEARAALAEAERIGCLACRVREENGG